MKFPPFIKPSRDLTAELKLVRPALGRKMFICHAATEVLNLDQQMLFCGWINAMLQDEFSVMSWLRTYDNDTWRHPNTTSCSYRTAWIDYLLQELQNGTTPNPTT